MAFGNVTKELNPAHAVFGDIAQAYTGDRFRPTLTSIIDGSSITEQPGHVVYVETDLTTMDIAPDVGVIHCDEGLNQVSINISLSGITKHDLGSSLASATNALPLSGIPGVNRYGDGFVKGDYIYLPVSLWNSTEMTSTGQKIVKYNLNDLTYDSYFDISAQGDCGAWSICTNHYEDEIYVCSRTDESIVDSRKTDIYRFDLETGSYLGILVLDTPVRKIQSLTVNEAGSLYVTCDDTDDLLPKIYQFDGAGVYISEMYLNGMTTYPTGITSYKREVYFATNTLTTVHRIEWTHLYLGEDPLRSGPAQFLENADMGTSGGILLRVKFLSHENYRILTDCPDYANSWESWVYGSGVLSHRVTSSDRSDISNTPLNQSVLVYLGWNEISQDATLYRDLTVLASNFMSTWTPTPPGGLYIGGINGANSTPPDTIFEDIIVFNTEINSTQWVDIVNNYDTLFLDYTKDGTGDLVSGSSQLDAEGLAGTIVDYSGGLQQGDVNLDATVTFFTYPNPTAEGNLVANSASLFGSTAQQEGQILEGSLSARTSSVSVESETHRPIKVSKELDPTDTFYNDIVTAWTSDDVYARLVPIREGMAVPEYPGPLQDTNYIQSFGMTLVTDSGHASTQGIAYTTEGSSGGRLAYISSTSFRVYDGITNLIVNQTTPFSGLPVTGAAYNHLGDGFIHEDELFIPAVAWDGGTQTASSKCIAVYTLNTGNLSRFIDLSTHTDLGGSALCVNREGTEIWAVSFLNFVNPNDTRNTDIYRFDLVTSAFLGIRKLGTACQGMQSIQYFDGSYFIGSSDWGSNNLIYRYDTNLVLQTIINPKTDSTEPDHEMEGLTVIGDRLHFHYNSIAPRELDLGKTYFKRDETTPTRILPVELIGNTGTIIIKLTPKTLFNYSTILDNMDYVSNWEAWIYETGTAAFRVDDEDTAFSTSPLTVDTEVTIVYSWSWTGSTTRATIMAPPMSSFDASGFQPDVPPPPNGLWVGGVSSSNNSTDVIIQDIIVLDRTISTSEGISLRDNLDALFIESVNEGTSILTSDFSSLSAVTGLTRKVGGSLQPEDALLDGVLEIAPPPESHIQVIPAVLNGAAVKGSETTTASLQVIEAVITGEGVIVIPVEGNLLPSPALLQGVSYTTSNALGNLEPALATLDGIGERGSISQGVLQPVSAILEGRGSNPAEGNLESPVALLNGIAGNLVFSDGSLIPLSASLQGTLFKGPLVIGDLQSINPVLIGDAVRNSVSSSGLLTIPAVLEGSGYAGFWPADLQAVDAVLNGSGYAGNWDSNLQSIATLNGDAYRGTHTSGGLTPNVATLNGKVAFIYDSTGALTSVVATLLGKATSVRYADGSLQAGNIILLGAGLTGPQGDGDLVSDGSSLDGTLLRIKRGQVLLVSGSSSLQTVIEREIKGTASLVSEPHTLIGAVEGYIVDITSDLISDSSTMYGHPLPAELISADLVSGNVILTVGTGITQVIIPIPATTYILIE